MTQANCASNGGGPAAEAVPVFAHVPELLRGVPREAAEELMRLRVPSLSVQPGPWVGPLERSGCQFGFLILGGILARRVSFGRRTAAELLGSGDLILPWVPQLPAETITTKARWQALDTVRLAVLDTEFARRVARWPQVPAALLERTIERARMMEFQQVASHIPGLEGRLLAILWGIADRWGRVTPDGVLVPVQLTHAILAELVGASRPSVSTVLKVLEREGALGRQQEGWLLNRARRGLAAAS